MRSFKNKHGDIIEVSYEHLETAVKIKKALQSQSPSMKCSWAKHRELMKKEGFEDSENSESYRQLIKSYQKSIGELPPAPKYAEMVSESQLDSIKDMVGELAWEKREIQHETKKLGKTRRDIIDGSLFINEATIAIKNVLSDINFKKVLSHTFSPIKDHGKTRIVALISDWHIGADVDVEGNQYNLEIARERIDEYTDKLIALATERKAYRIDVVYMGDMVEGGYMRSGQAYGIEFPVSEQMAIGGQLLIEMLLKLSKTFFTVYSGFAGNHDRMNQSDKNGNIDGDTAMVVVNKIVKVFIDASDIENLMFSETHPYHKRLIDVNGVNIKLVHGDLEKKADYGKIHDHSSRDGIIYDVIAYGHLHHYMCLEVGINKFEIRVGSTKGSDDYSEKLGLGSAPSQAVLIINGNGEIEPRRIGLGRTWVDVLGIRQ